LTTRSVQRILANDRNLVRDATLTPSSVKSIANAVQTLPQFRTGNGLVKVSGTYSGADDAGYDVEIVDTVATLPIISKPTFKGAGNGLLSSLTATGLPSQSFTITLGDLGLQLLAAQTEFEGVKLKARAPGVSGNAIHIHVDNSTLVFTDTQFSTIEDIKAGASDALKGAQFDWSTQVLGGARAIPAGAHRVAFGDDTNHVYLQWKEWKKDAWNYGFTPALASDVGKGTKVKFVTGGRIVTVTDGTVTETYTNIISIFDFLNALKTSSALVDVVGVVANDRAPGGQASIEFKLRTDAYAVANAGSNKLAASGFEAVTIGALANTEVIEARCIAATAKDNASARVGSEVWALKGSVSGDLGTIVSGTTYIEPSVPSKFTLRVPRRVPDGFDQPRGKFSVTSIAYASRSGTIAPPDICVRSLVLGPSAVDQTVTLVYTRRPTGNCGCEALPFPDLSNNTYLTGIEGVTPLSDITTRINTAYEWRRDWFSSLYDGNILYTSPTASPAAQSVDVDFQSLIALLKSLSGTGSTNLNNWDVLWDEFVQYAGVTLPGGLNASGGVSVSEAIGITATGFEFELANKKISALVIKDSSPSPQTLTLATNYTADLDHGRVTFVNLSGFVAPFKATYDRTVGNHYASKSQNVDGQLNGSTYGLGGINVSNFRAINPATNAVVSPTNYTINPVSGTITWLANPAPLGSEASQERRRKAILQFINIRVGATIYGAYCFVVDTRVPVSRPEQFPLLSTAIIYDETGADVTSSFALNDFVETVTQTDRLALWVATTPTVLANLDKTFYLSCDMQDTSSSNSYLVYEFNTSSGGASSGASSVAGFEVLSMGAYNDRRQSWAAAKDDILAKAGKFDANTVTGDGSWRDFGDALYWSVKGSVGGAYAQAFTNRPYFSASAGYNATHEFAFQINVAPACVAQLKEGDAVTLLIGDAAWPATYQVGDTMSLSIIAAQDLFLQGGQAGTNLQTWYVSGSVDGPKPNYVYDPGAPAPYSASGLAFSLSPGTIPFAKGDEFKFTIEGGHYHWRKDAGAWSASLPIDTTAQSLSDSLNIQFLPGAAPSFAVGDLHKFRVIQPNRVSNLRRPNFDQWAWSGSSATLEIDFGAAGPIDAMMMTYHTLSATATVTIELATTAGAYGAPITLTWHQQVISKLLSVPISARYARLNITNSTNGRIGWLWLGSMLAAECCQGQFKPRYDYHIERAGLINGGAQAYGKAVGGEIKWDTGALTDTDRVNFVKMFDHVKLNHDQAVVIYPHYLHEDEAYLARILDDKLEIPDWNLYHPDDKANRALSVTLPFEGVIL
jgi:hypothetical protein